MLKNCFMCVAAKLCKKPRNLSGHLINIFQLGRKSIAEIEVREFLAEGILLARFSNGFMKLFDVTIDNKNYNKMAVRWKVRLHYGLSLRPHKTTLVCIRMTSFSEF